MHSYTKTWATGTKRWHDELYEFPKISIADLIPPKNPAKREERKKPRKDKSKRRENGAEKAKRRKVTRA